MNPDERVPSDDAAPLDGGAPLAVVTGASRGIGRATAIALSRRGCRCLLLGRPSAALHDAVAACRDARALDHRALRCDVSDVVSIDEAAKEVLALGTPRTVVHSAGIVERASLEDLSIDSLRRQLDTNLVGPIWLTRALLPSMRAKKRGSIVNVGSISGQVGTPKQVAYNASKWALLGFTKCLAEELSDSGLFTVVVLPGAVDTDMLRGSDYPARMRAEDVAKTLVHYALDAPVAHNGAIIEMFGT